MFNASICACSFASARERADGSRRRHAQYPLAETSNTRHIVALGYFAL